MFFVDLENKDYTSVSYSVAMKKAYQAKAVERVQHCRLILVWETEQSKTDSKVSFNYDLNL